MAKNFGKRVAPKLRYKNRKIKNAPAACEEIVTAPVVEEVVETVEEIAPVVEEVVETVEENAPVVEEVVETVEEIAPVEEIAETPVEEVVETVEEIAPVEEIAETPAEEVVEEVEEIADEPVEVAEEPACEPVEEEPATDEVDETIEEVPLEMGEEEMQTVLDEEGSLDGSQEEVEDLASAEIATEEPVVETVEETAPVEEPVAVEPEAVEEVAEPVEEPAPAFEEVAVTQVAQVEDAEDDEEEKEEVVEKPKKDEFTLTAPANLDDILSRICTKRARKLIYRPSDVIFSHTTTVLGTDKTNDEKIKIKSILDAEIKQGVKLGYLDKFDGLKMSELKEEYENDIVYEYADQEFKRTGILLDGDKVKVYVYDWDMKACHHVGYIDDESANLVKPYLLDSERYSFDINGIIVGGKFKKITKDEKTGKITVEKGNDGNLGLEIDINIINRKD